MDKDLKTNFDVVVFGTGFTESLVAAAAARVGKKVLHLDRNDYYGGQWASFSLSGLEDWINFLKEKPFNDNTNTFNIELKEDESLFSLNNPNYIYFGVKNEWHVSDSLTENDENPIQIHDKIEGKEVNHQQIPEHIEGKEINHQQIPELIEGKEINHQQIPEHIEGSKDLENELEKEVTKKWTKDELLKVRRKFNLDLAPNILFSRGCLVELLISSNVARYVEFKCVSRILTWINGESDMTTGRLVVVPCSRSDIFTSDVVGLVEKRLLMKFLKMCINYKDHVEEWRDYADKPFRKFLTLYKLTDVLIGFIIDAIAMVDGEILCEDGLKKTSHFLNSLGRFGAMPFLYNLYGSGELPQAFCRLCAVFEGVYILRREVDNLIISGENRVCGFISQVERFTCQNVVMDSSYIPELLLESSGSERSLSRGIFITNGSILESDREYLTLLRIPKENGAAITVLEVGPSTGTCANGTFVVHMTCEGSDAERDLETGVERLFSHQDNNENKPKILFSLYFNQRLPLERIDLGKLPTNLYLCSGPNATLDYDGPIAQAKCIFTKMFPEEEFLPRAPDPEEIVFDEPPTNQQPTNDVKQDNLPDGELQSQ